LRNHCHQRSPRVRGKEFENNCLDTFEDPRTGDKSITDPIHVYASELWAGAIRQHEPQLIQLTPNCNETAELYNFSNL
jgi:hypothetical protein